MLCKYGIASMAELLDPEGVWTTELLKLMLPVAMDLGADDASTLFGASAAAVSLIGGPKGAESFTRGVQKTRLAAKAMMREARGLGPEKAPAPAGETAAEQIMTIFGAMGLRPPKKRMKQNPTQTRKHKGK